MTFEIQYDNILSRELHILVHDVTSMPITIKDPMITELHQVEYQMMPDMSLLGLGMGFDIGNMENIKDMGNMEDIGNINKNMNESNPLLKINEHNFKVTPKEVQNSDWIWETSKGQIQFSGSINKDFIPFEMDFWLR